MLLTPFFQEPKKFVPVEPKKRTIVHRTTKGRVVYNRPRHFFTPKDLRRILKNILENDQGKKVDFFDFLKEWGEIQLMLLDLLALQGGIFGSNPVYDLIRYLVVELVQGKTSLPADIKKKE